MAKLKSSLDFSQSLEELITKEETDSKARNERILKYTNKLLNITFHAPSRTEKAGRTIRIRRKAK